ncbi:hypothetical protein CQA63_05040 [Helicobacter marmotae]|uniref:Uncharacterized protein n=1 Tax=Helicobacter marmotae TaxID=152490 RepID=A0A3D8I480_9HELI|nr:hypothetical protein CQA63_05040 [Helicobacter marmotae]
MWVSNLNYCKECNIKDKKNIFDSKVSFYFTFYREYLQKSFTIDCKLKRGFLDLSLIVRFVWICMKEGESK